MDYGKHTLTGDNTKTLTLKYVEGQWAVDTPITFPVECEEDLFPVHLVIYRNGNTTTAYKDIALESQPTLPTITPGTTSSTAGTTTACLISTRATPQIPLPA